PRPGPPAQVVPGVTDRGGVRLDADHCPVRPDRRSQRSSEEPRTAVKIERHVTGPWPERGHDGLGQHVGGTGMDLPEHARTDPPVPSRGPMAEVGPTAHGGQAVTDSAEYGIRTGRVRGAKGGGRGRSPVVAGGSAESSPWASTSWGDDHGSFAR